MMVRIGRWNGSQVMSLEAALTPNPAYEGGEIERLRDDVSALQGIVAKLLARMVESGTMTLSEAGEVVGEYDLREVRMGDDGWVDV